MFCSQTIGKELSDHVNYTTFFVDVGGAGGISAEGGSEFLRQSRARKGVQRGFGRRNRGFPGGGGERHRWEGLPERLLRKGFENLVRPAFPPRSEGQDVALQNADAEAVPKGDLGFGIPCPKALSGGFDAE